VRKVSAVTMVKREEMAGSGKELGFSWWGEEGWTRMRMRRGREGRRERVV